MSKKVEATKMTLTRKFLVQEIGAQELISVYREYLTATTNARKLIGSGQGLESTYRNLNTVRKFKPNQYVPDATDFANNKMENYIFSDYILLPDSQADDAGIVEVNIDESDGLYPEFFLSGKMKEQYEKVLSLLTPSLEKYEFQLNIALQKRIYNSLSALTPATSLASVPSVAYVKSSASEQTSAIRDYMIFRGYMRLDNRTFAYGLVAPTDVNTKIPDDKYVNVVSVNDVIPIVNTTLRNTIKADMNRGNIRDKQEFEKVVSSFIEYPAQYKDVMTGTMTKLDSTNFVKDNQILLLEKRNIDTIFNYESSFTQFFARNDTMFHTMKLRLAIDLYNYTSVALFECDGLLKHIESVDIANQPIEVEVVTPPTPSR